MENKKIISFAVIALFLLNLGTLAFLFLGKGHHAGPPPPPHGGPAEFLIHELSLNADQQKQFGKLKEEHHARIVQIQDSMRVIHEAYFNELSSANTAKADSLENLIGSKQKEIEHITFDHFRKVRALCNADQQKKFDSIIQEALRMKGPRNGPPPPPPPPGE